MRLPDQLLFRGQNRRGSMAAVQAWYRDLFRASQARCLRRACCANEVPRNMKTERPPRLVVSASARGLNVEPVITNVGLHRRYPTCVWRQLRQSIARDVRVDKVYLPVTSAHVKNPRAWGVQIVFFSGHVMSCASACLRTTQPVRTWESKPAYLSSRSVPCAKRNPLVRSVVRPSPDPEER